MMLATSAARADFVTYEYRGADFDFINTPEIDPTVTDNPWLTRTQNYVSGWIVFDTEKLPGGSLLNANFIAEAHPFALGCGIAGCSGSSVHDYEFFDGVYTYRATDEHPEFFANQRFEFRTDDNGKIVSWVVELLGDPASLVLSSTTDFRQRTGCGDGEETGLWVICAQSSKPGVWSKVPEPSALLLMAGVLCGTLLWHRSAPVRRRRL
jgi:hypothetical protein